jgi:multiple sugar transport system substrate-binding protein/raffinose/stachyose/melibiose transport system substrate-binding protein
MAGKAAYNDYAVKHAMSVWKDLVDKGYFTANSNADTWTDASDKVARGKAAMTLMGTWITGYWNGLDLKPGIDYDFFPFPIMSSGIPNAVVGPVDGLVISANAKNANGAKKFLSFMMSNPQVQAQWTEGQGALSANTKVDPTKYNSVMQRALRTVANAEVYAFNYDLATPPPVAEVGLSMFTEFMDNPSNYDSILEKAEKNASREFKN